MNDCQHEYVGLPDSIIAQINKHFGVCVCDRNILHIYAYIYNMLLDNIDFYSISLPIYFCHILYHHILLCMIEIFIIYYIYFHTISIDVDRFI